MSLRILVVDDDVDSAETQRMLLSIWGYQARSAHSGPEALESVGEFRPDVVLLDLEMPGLDGYHVAERLREMPDLSDAVLVAVTGHGREDDRRHAMQVGFAHHLVKPVEPDELGALLGLIGAGAMPDR
jgi:two-component system CheB/CheR fusion protein